MVDVALQLCSARKVAGPLMVEGMEEKRNGKRRNKLDKQPAAG